MLLWFDFHRRQQWLLLQSCDTARRSLWSIGRRLSLEWQRVRWKERHKLPTEHNSVSVSNKLFIVAKFILLSREKFDKSSTTALIRYLDCDNWRSCKVTLRKFLSRPESKSFTFNFIMKKRAINPKQFNAIHPRVPRVEYERIARRLIAKWIAIPSAATQTAEKDLSLSLWSWVNGC